MSKKVSDTFFAILLVTATSTLAQETAGDDSQSILTIDHYVTQVSAVPSIEGQHTQLYVRERGFAKARWTGKRAGLSDWDIDTPSRLFEMLGDAAEPSTGAPAFTGLRDRERAPKRGAAIGIVLGRDRPAVRHDDRAADREAETEPILPE